MGGHRKRKLRFILYMNIADLIAGLGAGLTIMWVVHPATQGFGCQIMVWTTVMGNTTSCLWSVVIATYVASCIFYKIPHLAFELISQIVWIGCVIIASMCYILNYPTDFYTPDPDGSWCWVPDNYPKQIMYFEYVWVFFALGYLFLVYPAIAFRYWSIQKKMVEFVKDNNRLIFKLAGYPFIFMIAWLPMATTRVIYLLGGKVSNDTLIVVVLWHALNGFFNAVWFSYSRNIVSQLKDRITKSTSKGGVINKIFLRKMK